MSRITPDHGVELWAPAPEYEDLYEVSNLGRIRRSRWGSSTFIGRVLDPSIDEDGYRVVRLSRDGKTRSHFIHRLVLRAFVGAPKNADDHGRHYRDDPSNNILWHLSWGTAAENAADRRRIRGQAA